jgi:hypothetical protein
MFEFAPEKSWVVLSVLDLTLKNCSSYYVRIAEKKLQMYPAELALLKGGSALYSDIYSRRAFLWPSNPSLCRAADSVLERCSARLLKRNCLWGDGSGNTIKYDHIAHWGIDHLPRGHYAKEESIISVSHFIN